MNHDLKTCLEIIKKCAEGASMKAWLAKPGHLVGTSIIYIDTDLFLANLEKEINDLEK